MYDEDEFGPSKTQLKKDADRAQKLGIQLLSFNEAFLQTLNLEDVLFDAIMLAKNIRQHGGKRRQVQLIGKLMRRADVDAIEAAIKSAHAAKVDDRQQHHQAERIRERLISGSPTERERLLTELALPSSSPVMPLLKDIDHYEVGSPAYKKTSRNLFRELHSLLS